MNTIRQAIAINDPEAVIVTKSTRNPRKWVARNTGGEFRCVSTTRKDATLWGRYSQSMILRKYTTDIRAYCGQTGKRLA
jgi:hypothetical protein